jgi:phage gp29-like protein
MPSPQPPTDRVTVVTSRYEPSAIAQTIDVDSLHSILRCAEAGDTRDLFRLYRDVLLSDSHLQAEFAKRKLAVLGDRMTFVPYDRQNAADVAAADAVRAMVSDCRSWFDANAHLLDSVLWPVSVVEKVYAPSGSGYAIRELVPVPHYLQDYSSGVLRIYDVDPTGLILPTSHDADPARYIMHRGHLLSTPDNWGGPMRSILFWWLLGAMSREWWARFLDRFGAPFPVGKYDANDAASRSVLQKAFSLAVRVGGLVVTKDTEVELQQVAASQTGEAYERFLTICQREKSKLVLGQTLSAEAQPTGLGSGVSDQQEAVRQDIRQFDALRLGATLRNLLVSQFLAINGFPGRPPLIVWGSETAVEARSTMAMLASAAAAGLEVDDPGIPLLSERVGLPLRRSARPTPALTPFSASPRPFPIFPRRPAAR